MTKSDIWKNAKAVLAEHGASVELVSALAPLLKPQRSGGALDVSSVTRSKDGVITHIECSLSGVYLPATEEYFPTEKDSSKGINGFKRQSLKASALFKEHKKQVDTSVRAIMQDVLDGVVEPDDGKSLITNLKESKVDYTSVVE